MKRLQNLKNRLQLFGLGRLKKSAKQETAKSRRLNINDFKEQEDFFLFI